jgi:hypothetical protein
VIAQSVGRAYPSFCRRSPTQTIGVDPVWWTPIL